MAKAVKFAVSIPRNEFKELETLREKKGLTRSEFIRETFKLWKKQREKKELVKIYEEAYITIPEKPLAIEAWEKASLSAFTAEEW